MDLADIDVKVLYDFEYTTKDGKQVFIKQGEKLLLIRKTNDDWWQVIRKSGRPFYVPASYVEEANSNDGVIVNKFANNNSNNNNTKIRVNFADVGQRTVDRIIKNRDESQGEVYRSRSCSFESQKAYGVNRKPVVPKRIILEKVSTLFEDTLSTSKDNKLRADSDELNFMKPNFLHVKHQNYPDDEDDEEADYVNLPKVDRCSPPADLEIRPENKNYSDNSMSTSLSSTDSDRLLENNNLTAMSSNIAGGNGYSRVNVKSDKTLPLADESGVHLNLSNSLEELSHEICEKSSLIRNTDTSSSGYRRVSDIVKHITIDNDISSKNINNTNTIGGSTNNSLKLFSSLSRSNNNNNNNNNNGSNNTNNENEKSKLQYAGSFKTKHERDKWAKNYVLLTAMKEEEVQEHQNGVGGNNLKKSKKTDDIDDKNNVKHDNGKVADDFHCNKEKSDLIIDADANIDSRVRICDRISNYEVKVIESTALKSSSSSLRRPVIQKKIVNSNFGISNNNHSILNSSSEELAHSPTSSTATNHTADMLKSSISDKGSTDSLLDVDDNPFGNQDGGSFCTTASDSLLHTSDTSDEEFQQIITKPDGGHQKKKKSVLTRNGRIESCRLRFPVRGVSPPVPELNQKPSRELFGGWSEYTFSDGRTFFYNCKTGEKSWKPPRRRSSNEAKNPDDGSISNLYSGSSSPLAGIDEITTAAGSDAVSVDSAHQQQRCYQQFRDSGQGSSRASPSYNVSTFAASVTGGNIASKENEQSSNNKVVIGASRVSPLQQSSSAVNLPAGWKSYVDSDSGFQCYVNSLTGARWFSSHDEKGRVYYFEENSSESSWTLPSASTSFSSTEKLADSQFEQETAVVPHVYSNVPPIRNNVNVPIVSGALAVASTDSSIAINSNSKIQNRADKTRSLIVADPPKNDVQSTFVTKNWPQLWDGHMCVLKEGTLNRTKITENGKRIRKNWSSSHVVLTELLLLFFKDAKAFVALKTGGGRPEMCVDLNGALIDCGDKVSSRKNVYIISTVLGLQVLIQNDCMQQADLWLLAIQSAIKNLPSGFDSCPRLTRGLIKEDSNPSPESESSKKFYKVTRSKSIKAKNKDGSIEDLTVSPAERQTKIKARLKKFFHRRPTMEALVKKGIWKDEPVFGSYLDKVCPSESPRIPLFVQQCINCIEITDENMKTDGLYRASGNLSQVQKIRLQVDQNNLSVLEEEEDVHVLTGTLKLFFRELKEPLIPYHSFNKAIKASNNHNKKEKIATFREIVKSLPTAHYDTLKLLLQHLLRVTKYKEFNRMHIPNLAIVFGPTLMWPKQESMNMALDLMQQNLVIECFLLEFDHIFKEQ